MQGDDRVRFCQICQKKVFNLCVLSPEEARQLIESQDGKLCALVYGRRDGTVLLEDCPVGAAESRRRFWRRALAAAGAAILALVNGHTLVPQRKPARALPPNHGTPRVSGASAHSSVSALSPQELEKLKLLGSLGY